MNTSAEKTVDRRVVIDLDRCIECRSCAAACFYGHTNVPAIGFARAGWALLPVVCRQCKSAACVDACPAEAMVREESGIVKRRLMLCVGCGSCVRACPFGVLPDQLSGAPSGGRSPAHMSGHQAAKCDLCADRTAAAQPRGIPRCVAACASGALTFVDEHHPSETDRPVIGGRATGGFYQHRASG